MIVPNVLILNFSTTCPQHIQMGVVEAAHTQYVHVRVVKSYNMHPTYSVHTMYMHTRTYMYMHVHTLITFPRGPANHATIMSFMMTRGSQLMNYRMSLSSCAICFHDVTAVSPTQLLPTALTWLPSEPATCCKTGRIRGLVYKNSCTCTSQLVKSTLAIVPGLPHIGHVWYWAEIT